MHRFTDWKQTTVKVFSAHLPAAEELFAVWVVLVLGAGTGAVKELNFLLGAGAGCLPPAVGCTQGETSTEGCWGSVASCWTLSSARAVAGPAFPVSSTTLSATSGWRWGGGGAGFLTFLFTPAAQSLLSPSCPSVLVPCLSLPSMSAVTQTSPSSDSVLLL